MKRSICIVLAITMMFLLTFPATPLAVAASNEQQIFDYLTGTMGMNTAAACGILTNIEAESGFNPTCEFLDTNDLISYGICQWNGDRFAALKNYCARYGYSYTSLTGQLHYLQYELEVSESSAYAKVKNVENTASGAYTAGYNWARYFERCSEYWNGKNQYTTRAESAQNTYWPRYKGSSSSDYISKCTPYPAYCTVKVTSISASVRTLPCNSTTNAASKIIETASKEKTYTATALYQNTADNYWYRVTASNGTTGYIYAGYCSYVDYINDLTITNPDAPSSLEQGSIYLIGGTVSTQYSELTTVSAYVYAGSSTSGNAETGTSVSTNGKSYPLKGSAVDAGVAFNILDAGRYTYVVAAKSTSYYATSGTACASVINSRTLYSAGFNVNGIATISHKPVRQITSIYGPEEMVYIKGWAYDEDFIDRVLSAYITIGGVAQIYSIIAGDYCEDVPIEGKYHGFSGYIHTDMIGKYEVCVYATNVDEYGNEIGDDTLLASAVVTILPKHTHQYEATVFEADCLSRGYTTYICSCGDYYTDDYTDALGHDYSESAIVYKAPTASESGTIQWTCVRCGEILATEDVPAFSKSLHGVSTVREATCKETGMYCYTYASQVRSNYRVDFYFEIEQLSHNYVDDTTPPTCTERGYTDHICSMCGEGIRDNYVDPVGHHYISGVCTVCGKADLNFTNLMKGDLNGDGDITSADAVILAKYLADLTELSEDQLLAADLNSDGDVTSADAVLMARFLARLIDSFD